MFHAALLIIVCHLFIFSLRRLYNFILNIIKWVLIYFM